MQAAIAVIEDVEGTKRPISEALRDWGRSNRFAGSADRAAIGNIVYDVYRKRRSLAWQMEDDSPTCLVHAALLDGWHLTRQSLNKVLEHDKFAPSPLPAERMQAFETREIAKAPAAIQANLPDWIVTHFETAYGDAWVHEGVAFSQRPPLDIRVNTLKASCEKVQTALARNGAIPTPIARYGLRIKTGEAGARLPNIKAEPGYQKGWFEIQDEGSQIAADLVVARKGEQILDFCAGAGGKTLALSAAMGNKGQIHAYDANKHRLAPLFERIKRAGCRNVQVHIPGDPAGLASLLGRMDRVLVDAPCSGTGTWRRHPESKWKLTPGGLEKRQQEQQNVLNEAAPFVKPGGYFVYVTCSVMMQENEKQMLRFAKTNPEFEIVSLGEAWQELFGFDKPQPWSEDLNSITLTPAATNTDGFFIGVLWRSL